MTLYRSSSIKRSITKSAAKTARIKRRGRGKGRGVSYPHTGFMGMRVGHRGRAAGRLFR